uniref:Uncharacterized protein n=1 Tax=Ananas comosus var. bracteatus TaxID=296719 RepID=A0A6V7Q3P0_ANACO|nr:unnamed protein product [Ananas comosus var. bracteatus]
MPLVRSEGRFGNVIFMHSNLLVTANSSPASSSPESSSSATLAISSSPVSYTTSSSSLISFPTRPSILLRRSRELLHHRLGPHRRRRRRRGGGGDLHVAPRGAPPWLSAPRPQCPVPHRGALPPLKLQEILALASNDLYCGLVDGPRLPRQLPGPATSPFTLRLAARVTESSVITVSLGRVPSLGFAPAGQSLLSEIPSVGSAAAAAASAPRRRRRRRRSGLLRPRRRRGAS